jgi:hypothetical protein
MGKAEGINLGVDKEKRQIAINLLNFGLKLDDISKLAGLSVEEIKKL